MDDRQYQNDAHAAVLNELRRARTTLLTLATGLGKSYVAARLAAKAKRPVLWLAHRSELITQAHDTLAGLGVTVAVEKGKQKVDPANLPHVTVASVATMHPERLAAFAADAFGLVIVDESHHVLAKTWRAVVDYFPAAKVLGLSATPWREDGQKLDELFESTAYSMTLGDGIRQGFLCPLELVDVSVAGLNIDDVKTRGGDYAAGELEMELMREGVLHGIAKPLSELIEKRPTIAFTAGVKSAYALADILKGYGVTAVAVDGGMKQKDRDAAIQSYRDGTVQVLCNSNLATEGTDLPLTECIALARPTRSKGLKLQMIGRGTRLAPAKANCLIVDFVPGQAKKALLSSDVALGDAPFFQRPDVGKTYKAAERERAEAIAADAVAREEANRRIVLTVGVEFAITRLGVPEFLRASNVRASTHDDIPVTDRQLDLLTKFGFTEKDVGAITSRHEASALIDAVAMRRQKGLCSYKSAKQLKQRGLNGDVSTELAGYAMEQIKANNWRTPPCLLTDSRFRITDIKDTQTEWF